MSGRVVFGDFLDAARAQLDKADRLREAAGGEVDLQQISHSLLAVIVVMRRYVLDVTPGWMPENPRSQRPLTGWARAGAEARDALANAAAFLNEPDTAKQRRAAAGELAGHLDGVAASLAAGRDLLQTHLASDPGGERELHSEWGLVVTSPVVGRAVLAEIRSLIRRIAPLGAGLALAPRSRGTSQARQKLNAACQWLWVLDSCVGAAQRPVRASDLELLRAIPANALPSRRFPAPAESVAGLCQGVISSAQRVRHLSWVSGRQPGWSPDLTVNSLRRIAATSTLTSHHCELLLRSLAARAPGHAQAGHAAGLLQAAEAAARARQGWLHLAHALDRVTTETRLHLSPDADESADLALWTGRLAYADPGWTLTSGPAHQPRPPQTLLSEAGDARLAVAAVHYACDTLTSLGHAEREHIRAAGAAERILVTTRSLPATMDILRPFAPAPPDRIESLVSACDHTGRSAEQATAHVADIAAAIGAPSRVLTTARQAADPGPSRQPNRGGAAPAPGGPGSRRFAEACQELPGPVERTLHELGITDSELLQRGAVIDRAGEQLIIDAAVGLGPRRSRPSATALSRSADTARLVNHALASGDPCASALLYGPESAQREPPQAEP
jgi:hypothetical protein